MNQRIIELVEMLKTIPTGDNAQPFRYSISDDELEIIHLSEVSHHNFNQGNVASLLSFGMMIFVVKEFAETRNLHLDLTLSKNFAQDQVWASCRFSPKTMISPLKEDNLLPFLKNRRTDRGLYKKEAFNFDEFNKTFKDKIKFKDSLNKEAYKLITLYETMMFDDFETYKHIEAWVRYSKKDVESTKTGMSRQNMKLDPVNGFLFHFFTKGTFLNAIIKYYFKFIMLLRINTFYRQSLGYGLCVAKDSSDEGIIDMGGQIIKAWLMLTREGMVFQPISSPSLVSFITRNRNGKFHPEYTAKTGYCCEAFNRMFGTQGEIIWLFRFGKPMRGSDKDRTLRHDTNTVVSQKKSSESHLKVVSF